MRKYKKDKETGKMLVKLSLLDEWIDLENYIETLKKESKKKKKTFKDQLKNGLLKKIKEI